MVGFNDLLQKSSLPRSNRQYVPPLLLARGRGKRLVDMHNKGDKNINSHNGISTLAGDGGKSSDGTHPCKSQPPSMRNPPITSACGDDDAAFDPLFPPFACMGTVTNPMPSSPELVCGNFDSTGDDEALSSHEESLHLVPDGNMSSEHQGDESGHEVHEHSQDMAQNATDASSKKRKLEGRKRRGKNKCRAVAKLKAGEKLPITFFRNRAVGENQPVFVRHLGCIIRDSNICSVRVHKWHDIGHQQKEHMWAAVTEVFSNENMEAYKPHVLKHMNHLWNNWRSDLKRTNITNKKISLQAALKHVPSGFEKEDWVWLVKEVFSSERHQKASERNSLNRSNYAKELLHRTGSMPIEQLIWDKLGGKEGKEPNLLDVYEASHKKGDNLANTETTKKCDEIREVIESDGLLSNFQIAEKVFKSKSRERVVGHGGGVTLKEARSSEPTKADLQVELNAARKENKDLVKNLETLKVENQQLQSRQDSVEAKMKRFQHMLSLHFNVSTPTAMDNQIESPPGV